MAENNPIKEMNEVYTQAIQLIRKGYESDKVDYRKMAEGLKTMRDYLFDHVLQLMKMDETGRRAVSFGSILVTAYGLKALQEYGAEEDHKRVVAQYISKKLRKRRPDEPIGEYWKEQRRLRKEEERAMEEHPFTKALEYADEIIRLASDVSPSQDAVEEFTKMIELMREVPDVKTYEDLRRAVE